MAEWLGRALQKLPHQFESGRDLDKKPRFGEVFFIWLRVRGRVNEKENENEFLETGTEKEKQNENEWGDEG